MLFFGFIELLKDLPGMIAADFSQGMLQWGVEIFENAAGIISGFFDSISALLP